MSLGVPEEDVDERDDLQCFAQAHAMSEDTAEPTGAAETLRRLHQVVIQETNPTDLSKTEKRRSLAKAMK